MADLQQKSVEHLLSDDFSTFTPEEQTNVIHYLAQLTPIEKKACAIAKEHLETSYDILRSNGFVSWCEKKTLLQKYRNLRAIINTRVGAPIHRDQKHRCKNPFNFVLLFSFLSFSLFSIFVSMCSIYFPNPKYPAFVCTLMGNNWLTTLQRISGLQNSGPAPLQNTICASFLLCGFILHTYSFESITYLSASPFLMRISTISSGLNPTCAYPRAS